MEDGVEEGVMPVLTNIVTQYYPRSDQGAWGFWQYKYLVLVGVNDDVGCPGWVVGRTRELVSL